MSAPSGQHPVEYLFNRQKTLKYPASGVVVPVREVIPGTAFFPGGYGLWRGEGTPTSEESLPPMPCEKVMVLGNNFDLEKNYEASREKGNELYTDTWRNLRQLF